MPLRLGSGRALADDGTVYLGCDDNWLTAVNPDGSIEWEYDAGGNVYAPAVAEDGSIILLARFDDLEGLPAPGETVAVGVTAISYPPATA